MARYFYCYQLVFGDEPSVSATYIGQATSRTRVLTHLAASHNAKVRRRMAAATVWPRLEVYPLRHVCMGDLTLMEDALIKVAEYRTGESPRAVYAELLNGTSGRGSVRWLRPDASEDEREDPDRQLILEGVIDGASNDVWELQGWRPCGPGTIDDIRAAAERVGGSRRSTVRAGDRIEFLPAPGSRIDRVDPAELRRRLGDRGNALVVYISEKTLDDGRDPLGPGTSAADRQERCIHYWPFPRAHRARAAADVPDTVIAVTGDLDFRLVLGAWRVQPDVGALADGDWRPEGEDAEIPGIAGLVLSPASDSDEHRKDMRFAQGNPVKVLTRDGRLVPPAELPPV